jgi:phospholipase/carboxylesterase
MLTASSQRTCPWHHRQVKYATRETQAAVTLEPSGKANASVIWLHGLGADGHDFVPMVPELRLAEPLAVRFIFPHATVRPVTINGGHRMRAWYDITGFGPESGEDEAGIRESGRIVDGYVDREVAAGIASRRIVIAGFSQGGAVVLHAGLRQTQPLAGVLALSTYLPLRASLAGEKAGTALPILMCHGTQDDVVSVLRGRESRDLLQEAGYHVEWREYPMQHTVCAPEIGHIAAWLQLQLGATPAQA